MRYPVLYFVNSTDQKVPKFSSKRVSIVDPVGLLRHADVLNGWSLTMNINGKSVVKVKQIGCKKKTLSLNVGKQGFVFTQAK